jgi:hypothetical protein
MASGVKARSAGPTGVPVASCAQLGEAHPRANAGTFDVVDSRSMTPAAGCRSCGRWHNCGLIWSHSGARMAHMDLRPYIDEIHDQLEVAAETGGDAARALAQRLVAPLDAAVRLSLLDALAAAAQEITCELAPGSVEVRLRGRDPEFVVTAPTDPTDNDLPGGAVTTAVDGSAAAAIFAGDEGAMARINLRMPDHLKSRIDRAAAGQGLSVNAWLVRAAAAALEHTDPVERLGRRGPQGSERFTGWAR